VGSGPAKYLMIFRQSQHRLDSEEGCAWRGPMEPANPQTRPSPPLFARMPMSWSRTGRGDASTEYTQFCHPMQRYHPHVHLPLPCQPNNGNEARPQVHHPPVDSRHVSVRVEHQRPPARRWRVTSWSVPCLTPPLMGAKNGVLR